MPSNQGTTEPTPKSPTSSEKQPKSSESPSLKHEHRQVAVAAGRIEPKAESNNPRGEKSAQVNQSANPKAEQTPGVSTPNNQSGSKKDHATDTRPDATSKEAVTARE